MDRNGRPQLLRQTNEPGGCKVCRWFACCVDHNSTVNACTACAGHWQTSQECPLLQSQLSGCDRHHNSYHYGPVPHFPHSTWLPSSGLALSFCCETNPSCYWGPDFQVSTCSFMPHSSSLPCLQCLSSQYPPLPSYQTAQDAITMTHVCDWLCSNNEKFIGMAIISGIIIFFLTRYALNYSLTCIAESASTCLQTSLFLVHIAPVMKPATVLQCWNSIVYCLGYQLRGHRFAWGAPPARRSLHRRGRGMLTSVVIASLLCDDTSGSFSVAHTTDQVRVMIVCYVIVAYGVS